MFSVPPVLVIYLDSNVISIDADIKLGISMYLWHIKL